MGSYKIYSPLRNAFFDYAEVACKVIRCRVSNIEKHRSKCYKPEEAFYQPRFAYKSAANKRVANEKPCITTTNFFSNRHPWWWVEEIWRIRYIQREIFPKTGMHSKSRIIVKCIPSLGKKCDPTTMLWEYAWKRYRVEPKYDEIALSLFGKLKILNIFLTEAYQILKR